MMSNLAWEYGQDTIGYTTGLAVELNQPKWALGLESGQFPMIPETDCPCRNADNHASAR
jgi:hypothetical protein